MRLEEALSDLPILVVDDEEMNLRFLRRALQRAGCTCVRTTTDPLGVPGLFAEIQPDLVVLDLHMPGMDGFELMERLGPTAGGRTGVPFLVVTGDVGEDVKRRALESGARDFLTKPFSETEMLLRVRNLLEVQRLHAWLRDQNARLEGEVAQRTRDLERARLEILGRLALAAEFRDDETQEHAWRIGRTCGLLAAALGLLDGQVEVLQRAAPLHDIGKIGIPDAILLKPGKLTESEFATIRTHTTIGGQILSGSQSSVLLLAERIALSHHERWDGGGYPRGLGGEAIPLAGRIAAVADVFDALTHERPYKPAWPVREAVAEILRQRRRQFDPRVVDAFATLEHWTLLSRVHDSQASVNGSRRRSEAQLAGLV
jgi:putative two-component system response regulator